MILYLNPYCTDGWVHIRNRFLTTRYLKSGTAEGLHDVLGNVNLKYMVLEESKAKFIWFGCNVNIVEGELKGFLNKEFPWLVVKWYLSHRLELVIKDALKYVLKSIYFDSVDELLLRLYYIKGHQKALPIGRGGC